MIHQSVRPASASSPGSAYRAHLLILLIVLAAPLVAAAADKSEALLEATRSPGSLIGMQYETWFTPKNNDWETGYAVPTLGRYSSFDVGVIKKHEEWFEHLGVDWLLIDWSNMLWMSPRWEEHQGASKELEDSTELLLKTYSQLQRKGHRVPRIVLLLGLQNGPPVPNDAERLGGIFHWLDENFLAKQEYRNLWVYYEGKPLITIIYGTESVCEKLPAVSRRIASPAWTVRWMGAQLQQSHAEQCGMWSWMDGTIRQIVTMRDGRPEETVVTPSTFPNPHGWFDSGAVGRDNGVPYIESWKVAFEHRPKFIQIHQWNEFAGQREGEGFGPKHDLYVDSYNVELSDDIEPTRMDECGYRGCGGWGYYYVNLTKALISLYRNETPDVSVLALSAPRKPASIHEKHLIVREKSLPLTWDFLGKTPSGYALDLDGKRIADNLTGTSYALDLSGVLPGKHKLVLAANGVRTYFDLDAGKLTRKSANPMPVTSTLEFVYSPLQ